MNLGGITYSEMSSFSPDDEGVEVTNVVIGDQNVMNMAALCPLKQSDLDIWSAAPVLWISMKANLADYKNLLMFVMQRLHTVYKSDSAHIIIFAGYMDAPILNVDEIFDLFINIVEEAIFYNLKHSTNFSVSFGEIHYPAIGRRFDRVIFILNEVVRIINHFILQEQHTVIMLKP